MNSIKILEKKQWWSTVYYNQIKTIYNLESDTGIDQCLYKFSADSFKVRKESFK